MSLAVCNANIVPRLVFHETSTRSYRDYSPARALCYHYLENSSTDHAKLEPFAIRVVIQYGAKSALVIHPDENSNGVSRVQSSRVRNLYVAVSSSVKLNGAVPTTIRALVVSNSDKSLVVSNSDKSCTGISTSANVSSTSSPVQGIHRESSGQFNYEDTNQT